MPGLVGICGSQLRTTPKQVNDAAYATVYSDRVKVDDIYCDNSFILSQSHFTFLDASGMSSRRNDVLVWIDGEIYKQQELTEHGDLSIADMFRIHYTEGSLDAFLSKVDGNFIAVIYDLQKKELHLITDRYGLKIFYLGLFNKCLIVAPELKAFTYFKEFSLNIRKDAVESFLDLGHLVGLTTWFRDVEVTSPSTVYTFSWEMGTLKSRQYWSWSQIRSSNISIEDAAEYIGTLLKEAINARYMGDARIGIGLSGGFDSRAILATVYKHNPVTYTFGIKSSPDVKIASRVAELANVKNVHFEMHIENWLSQRFIGVWKTDGMFNLYHMHYSHVLDEIAKLMDINQSGFLADAVLGGTYLTKKHKTFLNRRIDESIAMHYYGRHFEFSNVNSSFFDIQKIDPYLFYNRGRRLIGLGMEEPNKTVYQRLPFMDNQLLDFNYSLPDEYRQNGKVYYRALALTFPEFFQTIPHATSRVPIQLDPSLAHNTLKFYYKWMTKIRTKLGMPAAFTNVHNWLKESGTVVLLKTILDPKHAIYPEYTDKDFLRLYLEPHLSGKGNYMIPLLGGLTLEVWLQQIFNKKYF